MNGENKPSNYVFINCPFDEKYQKNLFKPLVFTIMDCGFIPRCALENLDSSEIRLEKIYKIIADCHYGIHDISRVELDKKNNLPRFNMPLELGVFLGAKKFGESENKLKKCLVLDKDQYRYQKYLSDLSGVDIHAHNNNAKKIIEKIRNWLSVSSGRINIPSSKEIFDRYSIFKKNLPEICEKLKMEPNKIIYSDLVSIMEDWLIQNSR